MCWGEDPDWDDGINTVQTQGVISLYGELTMDDYMNYINNDVSQIESTFGENRKEWSLDEFMEKYPSDGFEVIPREDLLNKCKAISDDFIRKWVNRVDYGYDGGARFDALHVTSIVTHDSYIDIEFRCDYRFQLEEVDSEDNVRSDDYNPYGAAEKLAGTVFECGEPTENGGFYYMIDFDDEVNIEYSR